MAELFQTTKQNISLHINNAFKESELTPSATVKGYLTVQDPPFLSRITNMSKDATQTRITSSNPIGAKFEFTSMSDVNSDIAQNQK